MGTVFRLYWFQKVDQKNKYLWIGSRGSLGGIGIIGKVRRNSRRRRILYEIIMNNCDIIPSGKLYNGVNG